MSRTWETPTAIQEPLYRDRPRHRRTMREHQELARAAAGWLWVLCAALCCVAAAEFAWLLLRLAIGGHA